MAHTVDTIFDIGDRVRLGNHTASGGSAFTVAEIATDPTAITITLLKPDQTRTVWAWPTSDVGQETATREGAGRFYGDWTFDQPGVHYVRLAGTGVAEAADEWRIYVQPRVVS